MSIKFQVVRRIPNDGHNTVYLQIDGWDDFSFRTLFRAVLFDSERNEVELGQVKIANVFQEEFTHTSELLEAEFPCLEKNFFSLGQDPEYYETISTLKENERHEILTSLRDVVYCKDAFLLAEESQVFETSLLRFISRNSVTGSFKKILEERPSSKTPFRFSFNLSKPSKLSLEFKVDPHDYIPSNVHALIGSNGVGKTQVLRQMASCIVEDEPSNRESFFSYEDENGGRFERVVSFSFSAFDEFMAEEEEKYKKSKVKYFYVGLKSHKKENLIKTQHEIAVEFKEALEGCIALGKKEKLVAALSFLKSDPVLEEELTSLSFLLEDTSAERDIVSNKAMGIFSLLSSGHSSVLLMIVNLIEKMEEKAIVLIDEPEVHLHPPLLSAFLRSLSNILHENNAVAVIATHSPVVLQEIPRDCVWKMSRFGNILKADRPTMQTFGENVGLLTRDMFSLEVMRTGFYQFIEGKSNLDLSELVKHQQEFGNEGKAIIFLKESKSASRK